MPVPGAKGRLAEDGGSRVVRVDLLTLTLLSELPLRTRCPAVFAVFTVAAVVARSEVF